MRITTWNVNGYRSVFSKGLADWVLETRPDAVLLQEVRVHPQQLPEHQRCLPGYSALWNPAAKPGYSGVATFLLVPADGVHYGLGDERFDVEGRVIRTRHGGFLLYNVYFPSGRRGQERVGFKLDFYACLLEICDRLHAQGEKIILAGDFNTAHEENDLARPRENRNTSGFLPEERAWVSRYLQHGFVDVFRSLYPERAAYTWWTNRFHARERNIGWRIDYFLVSESLREHVRDVIIHTEVQGSDHCPVTLILDT